MKAGAVIGRPALLMLPYLYITYYGLARNRFFWWDGGLTGRAVPLPYCRYVTAPMIFHHYDRGTAPAAPAGPAATASPASHCSRRLGHDLNQKSCYSSLPPQNRR